MAAKLAAPQRPESAGQALKLRDFKLEGAMALSPKMTSNEYRRLPAQRG